MFCVLSGDGPSGAAPRGNPGKAQKQRLLESLVLGSRELATFRSDGTRQKSANSIRPETLLGFPWEERARAG